MTSPSPSPSPSSSPAPAPAPSQSQLPSQTPNPSFRFPREYHFPAFFTPQPNLTTHHAQLTKWSSLILSYTKHHRLFKLSLSSASESDLFTNRRISRRLALADIRQVIDFMRKDGRAEYAGSDKTKDGDFVYVYWKKPDEWAALLEAYVQDTAQKGSVLTLYELTDGEGTRGTELHGMDNEVLLKALNILVKRGKAQIFGSEDSLGVKFF
ncbi:vacuolar protein-sorting-associated protein [Metarhizium album ARSEF 1941]|uniref:Vacuolar protein-sorting-associated protein 25 n=1 Tax=Metarhizium album (strain ARSEF 1941) TaxID=1081103 RepID=A0A0B2X7P9_METAS|nr:vacuolar protein-sorting-associated protein [Metarhizium album ARSEF 1941]KHO01753.1 vacuolar protein-sorting-associated protein [Metarhizium album ARSEF 1941]